VRLSERRRSKERVVKPASLGASPTFRMRDWRSHERGRDGYLFLEPGCPLAMITRLWGKSTRGSGIGGGFAAASGGSGGG